MKKFLFIRHAQTESNTQKKYIGLSDEPLCGSGLTKARQLANHPLMREVDALFTGASLRCRQTAEILFGNLTPVDCGLREIDFGIFEGKSYGELSAVPKYREWLESGSDADIPKGGNGAEYKRDCCKAFADIAEKTSKNRDVSTTALVIHGGNIMAILEHFAVPRRDFYSYHVPNLGFILCELNERGELTPIEYPLKA